MDGTTSFRSSFSFSFSFLGSSPSAWTSRDWLKRSIARSSMRRLIVHTCSIVFVFSFASMRRNSHGPSLLLYRPSSRWLSLRFTGYASSQACDVSSS